MVTDEQRFQRWSAIIAGDDIEHRLAHGYYLTMQKRPSATASWLDNHNNESQFFRTDNLWSRLTERHRRCFGTVELRRKLSLELSRLIKNRYALLIYIFLTVEFRFLSMKSTNVSVRPMKNCAHYLVRSTRRPSITY